MKDLIHRLKQVSFEEKRMASFIVMSLFTNVPVEGAMNMVKKAVESFSDSDLCIRKADYVELVSLCVNFSAFVFDGQAIEQFGRCWKRTGILGSWGEVLIRFVTWMMC